MTRSALPPQEIKDLRRKQCWRLVTTTILLAAISGGWWLIIPYDLSTPQSRLYAVAVTLSGGLLYQTEEWSRDRGAIGEVLLESEIEIAVIFYGGMLSAVILSIVYPRSRILRWLAVALLPLWFFIGCSCVGTAL